MARPIGIVVAFPQEIYPFIKEITVKNMVNENGMKIIEGSYEERNIAIAISGLGKQNARKASKALMDMYFPQGLVSSGYSGALVSHMRPGTVIIPEKILSLGLDGSIQREFDIEPDWWRHQIWDSFNFSGILLCTDSVVIKSEQKLNLGKQFHAIIVDMESAGVAITAQEHRIPFCSIRVVTDTADENLPLDFNRYIDEQNNLHMGKVIYSAISHPSQLGILYQFMKNTNSAAKQLSSFLTHLFGKHPAV